MPNETDQLQESSIDQTEFESVFDLPDVGSEAEGGTKTGDDDTDTDKGKTPKGEDDKAAGDTDSGDKDKKGEGDKDDKEKTPKGDDGDDVFMKDVDGKQVFDAQAAMDFATGKDDDSVFAYDRPTKPDAAKAKPGAEDSDTPGGDKAPTYEETLSQNLLGGFDIFEKYVQGGKDVATALALARAEITGQMQTHLTKREFDSMREENRVEREKLVEQTKMVDLKPRATANLAEISKRYGGAEKFSKLLFSKAVAGDYVLMMYDLMKPESKDLRGEDLQKDMESWFNKLASNKGHARLMEKFVRGALIEKTLPRMILHARNVKDGVDKSNKEGRVAPSSNIHQEPKGDKSSNPGQAAWDRYTKGIDRV